MADLPSKQHFRLSERNLDLESEQAEVFDTVKSLVKETKLALQDSESQLSQARIEKLDIAEAHAEQLETLKVDCREEIAKQDFIEQQYHQDDLYDVSREREAKLFDKSQDYAAEIYAQPRRHTSDHYFQSQEHAEELTALSQKHETKLFQAKRELILLEEHHRVAIQTPKKEQKDMAVLRETPQKLMEEQHAGELQAQSDRYEAIIEGLKKDLSDKEHARQLAVDQYSTVLQEAGELTAKAASADKVLQSVIYREAILASQELDQKNVLLAQASNHRDALSTQISDHKDTLSAQGILYARKLSAVRLELDKLTTSNGHLKNENKGLKGKPEKQEAQSAKAGLSKAKDTIVGLETRNRELEDQLKTSESTAKEFFEEMTTTKANAEKVEPLIQTGLEIRSRIMMQAHRQLGMEILDDSDWHICDQVIERGNIAAHEPNGDLDYLIFEQNFVGGTLWDSLFNRLYGIPVNDWQNLSQIEKIISNARALLKSRSMKPMTREARSEVENVLQYLKALKSADFSTEDVQTASNQLNIARARFIELDRVRG